MLASLPRVVVDSCVYVDFLCKLDDDLQRRAYGVLQEHNNTHEILFPAVVQAEVIGIVRAKHPSGTANKKRRRNNAQLAINFFQAQRYTLIQDPPQVRLLASELIRDEDLFGADALIAATALVWKAKVLYTRDKQLLKLNGFKGLSVEPPPELRTLF